LRETIDLTSCRAWKTLKDLAVRPYDLSREGSLEKNGRLEQYVCRSDLLRLFFSAQRVNDDVLDCLQQLADELELVDQFKEMRRGGVINRIAGYESENRQVLHTGCRDFFTDNPAEPEITGLARLELDKLKDFLNKLEEGRFRNKNGKPFDTLVQVGIGGSDLGPRSVVEALKHFSRPGRSVRFVSNVDPDDCARVLAEISLETTLVNIVSKSGTTLETLANEKLVRSIMEKKGINPSGRCIAVTGKGSPMDNPDNYLRSFYMFDSIGGRFSTTSMVGLVALGFSIGFEGVMAFLKGAAAVDYGAEEKNILRNIPLLMALLGIWNRNLLGFNSLAVLPYSQALYRFAAHLQQCDMESNGKSVTRYGKQVACRTGPLVWGEPGTNGQHAFYQLLHQGTEIVPIEFIGFAESQSGLDSRIDGTTSQEKLLANLLAQMVAFATGRDSDNPNRRFVGNRPSSLLFARRLTPEIMGAILATYEAKIVFQGFAWNINSFDQEGVQLGKILAARFLKAMITGETGGKSLEGRLLDLVNTREL
jgi:glucose-6-phosphate isomerase